MPFNIPILLTWLRVALIPLVVGVFYLPTHWLPLADRNLAATMVFIVAAVTDWFDGFLARRWNQTSAFGAFLDPVADKLMIAVTLFLLVQSHRGGWPGILMAVTASIIVGREISVSALREWMAQIGARSKVKVAFLGKLKTAMQMVALVVLLLQHDAETLRLYHIGEALLVVAGILTIWSGLDYLRAAWPSLRGDSEEVKESEKNSVQSG
jgi:CDP-diacylglycerol--glycerol-3-phosphate 3-phosphatidyltransferase